MSWVFLAALPIAIAGTPDDAATLLSRYPAGRVPSTAPVFDAITDLQTHGEAEHLSVLHSLRDHEEGDVQAAAEIAISIVTLRARLERRESFAVPDSRDIRRWLSEQPGPMKHSDGHTVDKREQEAIAYASLVFDGSRRFADTAPDALLREGERLEDLADAGGAMAAYAIAAAQGAPQAFDAIQSFGVEAETLLLAMTADVPDKRLPHAPPETLEVLTRVGSTQTVAVLVERSQMSDQLGQVVALDALAEMLRREDLPASARRQAKQGIEAATHAQEKTLRAFARATLDEVE
ncbi:MAG: hypothetical protein AAFV53_07200 [Myxococcota bacterium]